MFIKVHLLDNANLLRKYHSQGSAMECGAILDVGVTLKLFSAMDHEKGTELLERIVSMLTKMMNLG
jgi:hypothetical protein